MHLEHVEDEQQEREESVKYASNKDNRDSSLVQVNCVDEDLKNNCLREEQSSYDPHGLKRCRDTDNRAYKIDQEL